MGCGGIAPRITDFGIRSGQATCLIEFMLKVQFSYNTLRSCSGQSDYFFFFFFFFLFLSFFCLSLCQKFCGQGWLSRYSDLLWAKQFGDRILVGARFSAPIQTDPGAHPAPYTMGTVSFLG
jgi:hypothetical protein